MSFLQLQHFVQAVDCNMFTFPYIEKLPLLLRVMCSSGEKHHRSRTECCNERRQKQIQPVLRCRFFLPPIILYAGLSVRKKAFFKNAPTIASTGILGTYMAFAIIAVLLYSIRKAVDIKLSVSPHHFGIFSYDLQCSDCKSVQACFKFHKVECASGQLSTKKKVAIAIKTVQTSTFSGRWMLKIGGKEEACLDFIWCRIVWLWGQFLLRRTVWQSFKSWRRIVPPSYFLSSLARVSSMMQPLSRFCVLFR